MTNDQADDEWRQEIEESKRARAAIEHRKMAIEQIISLTAGILGALVPLIVGIQGLALSWRDGLSVGAAALAGLQLLAISRLRHTLQSVATRVYGAMTSRLKKSAAPVQAAAIAALIRAKRSDQNRAALTLIAAMTIYLAVCIVNKGNPSVLLLIVLAGGVLSVQISALALTYRVRHGLYGTTAYEAREIVSFVLDNADKIDFSGGLGADELDLSERTEKAFVSIWEGVPA